MCSLSKPLVNTFTILGLLMLLSLLELSSAFSIREMVKGDKRADKGIVNCPPWHPFQCPNGDCIPFKYVCDGSPDCLDLYDEDEKLCTAARRAPPEETSAFLTALLAAHGSDFFVRLFGHRARNSLAEMGGIDRISVSLSQSPTIESFAKDMQMTLEETNQMRSVLQAIILGLPSDLSENETADFRFFVQKLQETNFF